MLPVQFIKQVQSKMEALGAFSKDVNQWIIAYSGGVDSRVLLDVLCKVKPEDKNRRNSCQSWFESICP